MAFSPINFIYAWIQWVLDLVFSPQPPPLHDNLHRPKIAVIGAGLTGVSSAAHIVGHGFDAKIFEAGGEDNLGGIWSRVNSTSGLQIHSVMYRFHPSIKWSEGYPTKDEIVTQIRQLWERYRLQDKTEFNHRVQKVYRDKQGRWIIDNPSHGRFDGIIAAIGSCGDAKMPTLPGQEKFKGQVCHSSQLDCVDGKAKKIVVVGGGASAVEAVEFAVKAGAERISILSRSDKWIIPRNPFIDILLAFNIFGQETLLSWIPESILRKFFYRDLKDIAPSEESGEGLFMSTPMVNSDILEQIRRGKAEWLRGDIEEVEKDGVQFNHRAQGVPKGGPGKQKLVEGDIIVVATGFKRPSLSFLPDEFFEEPYQPPNWYIQVFPPSDPTVCGINSTYVNAIGTVGNYHIGIYTRLLLIYLIDPLTRPRENWTKRWIWMTRTLKRFSPTGAFDFFTYSELIWWFCFTVAINPFRWKWALFVFFGIGAELPLKIVEKEDEIREKLHQLENERERKALQSNGHRSGKID